MTQDRLRQLLHYCPNTGVFTWRVTRSRLALAGTVAGYADLNRISIMVDGQHYFAHRLAWFYVTGTWPANEIDHADRDGLNNRWDNLRQASRSDNACNRGKQSNNTSGFVGVSLHKPTGRYQSYVVRHGKQHFVGRFDTPLAAAAAREALMRKLHGEFTAVREAA